MEKNEIKCQLLATDEGELPLNVFPKRKRNTGCVTVTINAILCVITCVAALIGVVYWSRTVYEMETIKNEIDLKIDHILKTSRTGQGIQNRPFSSMLFKSDESLTGTPGQTQTDKPLKGNNNEHEQIVIESKNETDFQSETKNSEEIDVNRETAIGDGENADKTSEDVRVEDNSYESDDYQDVENIERIPIEHTDYADWNNEVTLTGDSDDEDTSAEDDNDYSDSRYTNRPLIDNGGFEISNDVVPGDDQIDGSGDYNFDDEV